MCISNNVAPNFSASKADSFNINLARGENAIAVAIILNETEESAAIVNLLNKSRVQSTFI
jgi:hypothetical protein